MPLQQHSMCFAYSLSSVRHEKIDPQVSKCMSNQSMSLSWYREKSMWLVVALPVSAVIAGFFTLYLALSRPDHEVAEKPVPHALGSNSVTPPER
jgi:hypothetical protein